nr:hypothetical protein [Tanacetum cinerariifolium]
MASHLLHFRPKHRHLLRHFSSNNNNQSRPSFFTDLKSSLKQPQQSQPPHRPSFFNSNPNPNSTSQKVASLEEIRKNLSEFRSRSAVTPPPPSSSSSSQSPPISFQEMYRRNVMPKPDSGSEPVSLNAIRSSLKNMKSASTPRLQLNEISESLNLRPRSAGSAKSVVSDETKTEFVSMYSYVQLGEKLRGLRIVNEKKGSRKGKTFSLAELNERLKKLRELDDKEAQSNGIIYAHLRESLIKLNDDDKTKKSAAQRINVFAQLGGTPSFMLSPPKEELVEKYFHPDHMSSAEKQKLELKSVRDKFKISESDSGSSRVQVAQLTTKIKHLASVLHKKDKHSRKGLQAMVQKRKKLLKYLRRTDWDSYCFCLSELGLRDKYPQCYNKPLDSLKNWNNRFFWVDERVFPTVVDWGTNAPKDGMPTVSTYSIEAVRALDTHRTPIQKQPEMLLCLVGISRRYYLGDEVYPTFLHDDDRGRYGSIHLIHAPNPTKVKTGSRPRAPHEVPLLTLTATRVIEMDDPAAATDSSSVPSTIEKSPLDFADEAGISDQGTVAPEMLPFEDVPAIDAPGAGQAEEVVATDRPAATESRKRGRDGTDRNAPPKSLRRDHADSRPTGSSHGGKSLAAIQLGLASTVFVPENAPAGVSDPNPLSFADPPSRHPADIPQSSQGTAAAGDPDSKNASSPVEVRSPKSIYRPEWGVANGSLLDTPKACQDLVDHVAPPGYFSELRHMHNDEFLRQYNVNLARQVAMGSQLRLRLEQEAKLLRKSVAQVARRDKRIQARELEIKNLEALLETEADMKKAAEDRSAGLIQKLEDMRARFSDLQQCAELDARLDALSIDFDKELYPHMLTAIAGRRWVIEHGLRLAVMKCGESLEMRQAFADVVSAGIAKGVEGFEVSVSGSVGGPEGRAYGCNHGCPLPGERHWR